ncbi:carbon-nitrogen hydrolase family protein [Thiomicrorhabdus sp.]|uniref:carbon-nitrogen hydrolase family protein n=1 Tax=Thiomicrorhabdus sp. TaxID=2039724 RepID=UPI0035651696
MSAFKVAAAQYDIGFFQHWDDYAAKLESWIASATAKEAQLLVFPEYGSMELASLFDETVYRDLNKQLHEMQALYQDVQALHLSLARQHDCIILGASFPLQLADGRFRNRATLYGPEGILGYQDKLIMTRFENEQWLVTAGKEIQVIPTDLGMIGINICYDSEFPLIAQQQVRAGADLILVPSCTDTDAGFHRVRVGCQARALENQCYVVQSPTAGEAPWSEAVDVNTGLASIYTPIDYGFPSNGILAEGEAQTSQWVFAELDLAKAREIRNSGQVFNYRDWPKQDELQLTVK